MSLAEETFSVDLRLVARDYQFEDATKVVGWGGRGLLGHKTGLGKTFIALLAWELLSRPRKCMVIGSTTAIGVWKVKELPKWLGSEVEVIHIEGHYIERERAWKKAWEAKGNVFVLANFDCFRRDIQQVIKYKPDMLFVDEAHKVIRSRKTKTFLCIKAAQSRHVIIMSATLAGRGPQDLWAALHIAQPKRFSSYWKFVYEFCYVSDSPFGKEIIGVKNPTGLAKTLADNAYVERTYKEVLPQLPPITREVVDLELTQEQRKIYDDLDKDMIATLKGAQGDDFRLIVPNVLTKVVRLRQLVICPKLLGSAASAAGIEYLRDVLEDDPHTVVFTPFAAALPYLAEQLGSINPNGVVVFRGGMSPDEVAAAEADFKANKKLALCSIAFSQSFALDTVNTAYFLGASWDPTENEQAEGRLRRMDSQDFQGVMIRYLIHKDTVDEQLREVLNGKSINVYSFMKHLQERNK